MPHGETSRKDVALGLAVERLSREGWRCARLSDPSCPYSIIAARRGQLILLAVETQGRPIPEEELPARLQWATEFNAYAVEWRLKPDGTFEERTIHQPSTEVCREVGEQIDTQRMRELEQRAASYGLSQLLMMENAGRSIASIVNRYVGGVRDKRIVVVAGLGNNGGDGMAAGRHLSILGGDVQVILLGSASQIKTEEARINWNILLHMPSVRLETLSQEGLSDEQRRSIRDAHVVIDAIFGTGIKGEVREPHRSAIQAINESRGVVFAVDVPSGMDPDTGSIAGIAVKAHVTISLHLAKPGLLRKPEYVGELWIGSIGVPYNLS